MDKRIEFVDFDLLREPEEKRKIDEKEVDKIMTNIRASGYKDNFNFCITNDHVVVDGNHRHQALKQLDYTGKIPCLIIDNGDTDLFGLALKINTANESGKQNSLFDYLDYIRTRKATSTLKTIADNLGWELDQANKYSVLINKILPQVLIKCEDVNNGNGSYKLPHGSFQFTQGWFRTSGLYDLSGYYQLRLIDEFIEDKCDWKKAKVQSTAKMYFDWIQYEDIASAELHNEDDIPKLTEMIRNGYFKSAKEVRDKISQFNDRAKNKLIHGDCIEEIQKLEDNSIDIVITDPPYGIDYKSNRSKYNNHITKETVQKDDENAVGLFDEMLRVLYPKLKENAFFIAFTGWQNYSQFEAVIKKYLKHKAMPIWDKGNHGSGDLNSPFGSRHEPMVFATKGRRDAVKRIDDIISIPRIPSDQLRHPTQKPQKLIKTMLEAMAFEKDVFFDPFMGSGSHIKAAKEHGCSYIGIEIDKDHFEKAKIFINHE